MTKYSFNNTFVPKFTVKSSSVIQTLISQESAVEKNQKPVGFCKIIGSNIFLIEIYFRVCFFFFLRILKLIVHYVLRKKKTPSQDSLNKLILFKIFLAVANNANNYYNRVHSRILLCHNELILLQVIFYFSIAFTDFYCWMHVCSNL